MTVVGYFAMIIPSDKFWQAFFINETPRFKTLSERIRKSASAITSSRDISQGEGFGALLSTTAEGVRTKSLDIIAGGALAIRNVSGVSYFAIKATIEAYGTTTEFIDLESTSVEQAREAIRELPSVRAIEMMRAFDKLKPK
jgi:hypothetical protein